MEFNPTQFFTSERPANPYALLVLNQTINHNAWDVLRKYACFTVCADGGANHFYDLMKRRKAEASDLPDAIIGDLDSIRPEVRTHYESLGVSVIRDPDQYSTDFTKCLKYLGSNKKTIISQARPCSPGLETKIADGQPGSDHPCDRPLDTIILGGLGGRVDQAFSQIHHLYMASEFPETGDVPGALYLVSEESISFILRKGLNTILTPGGSKFGTNASDSAHVSQTSRDNEAYLGENVGIIPVNGPTAITTSGFEWDVREWETRIGGQLSTSNHIRADVVTVEAPSPVLFTAELAKWLKFSTGRGPV